MRIDAHHHIWDLAVRPQDWMVGEELEPISRSFLMADLEPHLRAHNIDYTVIVQTVAVAAETPEFLELAAHHPNVAGVVGWLDFESDDVSDTLALYQRHPAASHLVGIRDLAQFKSDPEWFRWDSVVRNIQRIGEAGYAVDVLTKAPQLSAAISTIARCPDTRFVIDHISKPAIARGEIDEWAGLIRDVARMENVWIKLSGMTTEADWSTWTPDTFVPYFDVVLEAFGPRRIMFGSDWPVCLLAGSYSDTVELASTLTSGLSPSEQADIFGLTAARGYQLDHLVGPAH